MDADKQKVIVVPDIFQFVASPCDMLFLSCDGIYEGMSNPYIYAHLLRLIEENKKKYNELTQKEQKSTQITQGFDAVRRCVSSYCEGSIVCCSVCHGEGWSPLLESRTCTHAHMRVMLSLLRPPPQHVMWVLLISRFCSHLFMHTVCAAWL